MASHHESQVDPGCDQATLYKNPSSAVQSVTVTRAEYHNSGVNAVMLSRPDVRDYMCWSIFMVVVNIFYGFPALIYSIKSKAQRNSNPELARIDGLIARNLNIAGLIMDALVFASFMIPFAIGALGNRR